MQAWECDFGLVSYWDNELQNYDVRTLKLSYNGSNEKPVDMRMKSAAGQLLFSSGFGSALLTPTKKHTILLDV